MMNHAQRFGLTFVAALVLALFTSSAFAGRFSLSTQTFTATFTRVDYSGGFGTTECALTIEGSLHSRSMAKVAGALVGYIVRAAHGTCSRGSATILRESLPWHIRYRSFFGTLPSISDLDLTVAGWSARIREPFFAIQCLFARASIGMEFQREAGGWVPWNQLSGSFATDCGSGGFVNGTSFTFFGGFPSERLTLTLI